MGVGSKDVKPFEINNRIVLGLAIPMTIAFITTPLLGLVDTAVVGQFGDAALIGGLAIGAVLFDLIFGTFNFLRGGTTALASQAIGAGDEKEKQAVLFRAMAIAICSGLLLAVFSQLILSIGLWFMRPGGGVAEAAGTYFLIRMLGAPFSLGNYAILGWLFGLGKSRTTLFVQVLINGTNIILSIALGLWLEWQVFGVAIATIIGEALGFFVGGYICWRNLDPHTRPSRARIMDWPAWKRLANLNTDMMIRTFALVFAFAYFTSQGAKFGEVTLAANAVLMHFFFVGAYFLDGMVSAVEQLVGKAVGANYSAGFARAFKLTALWGMVMALAGSMIFWLAGPVLIAIMTTSQDVRAVAGDYLLWAAFIPLAGWLAFQMDGVFIGATWSREMSWWMLVSLAAYLLTWELARWDLENHGLWLALYVFLIVRGITLFARMPVKARQTFGT